MAPGTEGGESLAEYVGQMYGDLPPADPPDEGEDITEDAAGAPPAEHTDPEGTDVPEGTEPTEHAGAPPADAAEPQPDEVVPESDPLASAVPLTYTVNGESRTYDGIKVLGEHGAIIDAKDLPDVMRKLTERDNLFEQSQQRYEKHDALERLTQWRATDRNGNETVLKGRDALLYAHVQNARLHARNAVLSSILEAKIDPRSAVMADEEGNVFWRADWVENLTKELSQNERIATYEAREHFNSLGVAPPPPPPSPADHAAPTIADFETRHAVQGLTPEDKVFLTQQFPRYVTPDGTQVDPAFLDLMKRTASANTSKAAAVSTASDIAKANAAKLAAARIGKPAVQAPRVPVRPKTPDISPRAQAESDAWDLQENTLAAGMRAQQAR